MVKKGKVGKARKDKFYHLAKETGYRSRAAFKLLQLNRKYEFLQKSRVCIDLCAAPGGWLQVAAQNMPISSLILGVDLVPIKTIHNVKTFQEDITTGKCRQTLKKELQTWKADVVLHDGAPNLGKNWLLDAFSQLQLTLQAVRLATDFLRKGGCFVSKVFRSKDYHALLWVLQQLFKRVHATKPQASRNESAEIFVVCLGYLAPDKLDPKFTDPKYVFKDVAPEALPGLNLIHPEKLRRKAEGYADGDYTLHHRVNVSQFLEADNHLQILADCHQFDLDDERIADHPLTTAEIKFCLKDIKVLGKKEIRMILNWRKKMIHYLQSLEETDEKAEEEEESEDEDSKMNRHIAEIEDEKKKELKRKKKKVVKEKRKLREKLSLGMMIPGDSVDPGVEIELFNVKKIKSKHDLKEVQKEDMMEPTDSEDSDSDEEGRRKKNWMQYERHEGEEDNATGFSDEDEEDEDEEDEDEEDSGKGGDDDLSDAEEEDLEMESDDEEGQEEIAEEDENPLVVDMAGGRDAKTKQKTQMWFSKDVFSAIKEDEDEDLEIESMAHAYKKKGGVILGEAGTTKLTSKAAVDNKSADDSAVTMATEEDNKDDSSSSSDDDSDDDSDSDYDINERGNANFKGSKSGKTKATNDGFEIVPVGKPGAKIRKLDPVSLAIGEELVKSSKRRREIIEMSYNRYTHGEEDLPDWFEKEEEMHNRKQIPVTKEQVQEYRDRLKIINARPVKKVAEAKARRKRRTMKKLEKARKKSEVVTDNVDVGEVEKWKQIKDIYKKAGLLKKQKREVSYVVSKRSTATKRAKRPKGVKGQYRVVDPRRKKDLRKAKVDAKKSKSKQIRPRKQNRQKGRQRK